ncbi:MAG: hypothetical protein AB7U29_15680 [Desulfobulbus sp.]
MDPGMPGKICKERREPVSVDSASFMRPTIESEIENSVDRFAFFWQYIQVLQEVTANLKVKE